ncbi:MAG TPA: glutamate synthase [Clostridiales bacterium]|nr:glutamate synthase [Clostridiales bacterium]
MRVTADLMNHKQLNDRIRESTDNEIIIDHATGQRYIASGMGGKTITINGTPGNALGCYLDGCEVHVNGNTQEATGDTMNDGSIYVNGSAGDATGYAMRGGKIIIKGNSGYRTGIHMKSYKDKVPVIVIGGAAGSFLGEYQAGGIIVVLGMNTKAQDIVGNFCGTGMHGGKIFLRCNEKDLPKNLSAQIDAKEADAKDMRDIETYLDDYCAAFSEDKKKILDHTFYVLSPDTKNPYHQLYTYS